ncbi:MAG: hypothetical protein QXF88_00925 [Candidatus Aenigmatarchaeota archaeon]
MHKTVQELVNEYFQKNGYDSRTNRGPMFNGGLDGLMKYLSENGYPNLDAREIYECLKNCESKNHSTRG